MKCGVTLTVPNAWGLHARPAAMLVQATQKYDAEIALEYDGRGVSAMSIMGILTLGAGQGARVTVTAEGRDAAAAIRAIADLFACSFHEEEAATAIGLFGAERQTGGVGRQRYGVAYATMPLAAPL